MGDVDAGIYQVAVARLITLLAKSLHQLDQCHNQSGKDYSRLLLETLDRDLEALESNEARKISQDALAEARQMADELIRLYNDQA